jgi:hypothetical protein
MIASIIARFGLHLAIGAGVLVTYFAWQKRIEVKAVQAERVRVETEGKKVDAKAREARRAAESKPHDSLRQYYRD